MPTQAELDARLEAAQAAGRRRQYAWLGIFAATMAGGVTAGLASGDRDLRNSPLIGALSFGF